MNKMSIKKILKGIEKHHRIIAKERDALDDFIASVTELSELRWDCQDAQDALEDARDALSRRL